MGSIIVCKKCGQRRDKVLNTITQEHYCFNCWFEKQFMAIGFSEVIRGKNIYYQRYDNDEVGTIFVGFKYYKLGIWGIKNDDTKYTPQELDELDIVKRVYSILPKGAKVGDYIEEGEIYPDPNPITETKNEIKETTEIKEITAVVVDESSDKKEAIEPLSTEITPKDRGLYSIQINVEESIKNWQDYQKLCRSVLNEDDYQTIKVKGVDKKFKKKSAFRKLATFYGVSDRIISQEKIVRTDGSFYWRIVVEARLGNRTSMGVGICDTQERKSGIDSFAHPEHDIYATAHTRAKNRAISDLVGMGEVSAEEMLSVNGNEK